MSETIGLAHRGIVLRDHGRAFVASETPALHRADQYPAWVLLMRLSTFSFSVLVFVCTFCGVSHRCTYADDSIATAHLVCAARVQRIEGKFEELARELARKTNDS